MPLIVEHVTLGHLLNLPVQVLKNVICAVHILILLFVQVVVPQQLAQHVFRNITLRYKEQESIVICVKIL